MAPAMSSQSLCRAAVLAGFAQGCLALLDTREENVQGNAMVQRKIRVEGHPQPQGGLLEQHETHTLDAASQSFSSAELKQAQTRLAAARSAEEHRHEIFGTKAAVGGATPVPPLSEPNNTTPILLELSAFEDGKRCGRTLGWALENAAHPERLNFRVLQARRSDSPDCISEFEQAYLPKLCEAGSGRLAKSSGLAGQECENSVLHRLQAWVMDPEGGKGPAHQRGVFNELFQYEQEDSMCLSTDSHMGFHKDWDNVLLQDWANTRNEFAVLSVYPTDISSAPGIMVDLCGYSLEDGVPRGMTGGDRDPTKAPYLTMNWAAGLSFHRCHMEKNVPVDRHLRWIFTGEEVDRAVRLFTHGYDTYLPTNNAVTHDYAHAGQAFWNYQAGDKANEEAGRSKQRLVQLLRLDGDEGEPQDFGKYGLGSQRSLEDWVRWSKVNLGSKWAGFLEQGPVTPTHGFCSGLEMKPVKDEVKLVASVGKRSSGTSGHLDAASGAMELEGEDADTRPRLHAPDFKL
eukprot:TRINITY_DN3442_c0_g2_i1.p1 TRINITY_DN3442_c0_g2~~TRINITY_DN3442_c0_g2_i1.p1  ORF type:complete len:514 (-),score=129.61 TRINITY_DN3442_c0_g2_i1:21-1562(-)